MPDELQIIEETLRDSAVLMRLKGRLDARSATRLLERCAEVRASGQHLVVNLSEVSFIASSGIGAILALAEQFKQSSARVCFVALSSAVDSVIKLLNLDRFLAIHANEADALSALGH